MDSRTLDNALEQLTRALRQAGHGWGEIQLFETPLGGTDWQAQGSTSLEDYRERFEQIVRPSATRNWINLSANRVERGTLLIEVEWYPDPSGGKANPDDVALNVSSAAHLNAPFR